MNPRALYLDSVELRHTANQTLAERDPASAAGKALPKVSILAADRRQDDYIAVRTPVRVQICRRAGTGPPTDGLRSRPNYSKPLCRSLTCG